jgi:hypothetical protein
LSVEGKHSPPVPCDCNAVHHSHHHHHSDDLKVEDAALRSSVNTGASVANLTPLVTGSDSGATASSPSPARGMSSARLRASRCNRTHSKHAPRCRRRHLHHSRCACGSGQCSVLQRQHYEPMVMRCLEIRSPAVIRLPLLLVLLFFGVDYDTSFSKNLCNGGYVHA